MLAARFASLSPGICIPQRATREGRLSQSRGASAHLSPPVVFRGFSFQRHAGAQRDERVQLPPGALHANPVDSHCALLGTKGPELPSPRSVLTPGLGILAKGPGEFLEMDLTPNTKECELYPKMSNQLSSRPRPHRRVLLALSVTAGLVPVGGLCEPALQPPPGSPGLPVPCPVGFVGGGGVGRRHNPAPPPSRPPQLFGRLRVYSQTQHPSPVLSGIFK